MQDKINDFRVVAACRVCVCIVYAHLIGMIITMYYRPHMSLMGFVGDYIFVWFVMACSILGLLLIYLSGSFLGQGFELVDYRKEGDPKRKEYIKNKTILYMLLGELIACGIAYLILNGTKN